MLQVSYTNEAWATQLKNPQDRRPIFAGLAERCGGKLRDAYRALGEADIVAIYEALDAAAASGIGMAIAAAGHCKAVKTTALVSIDDGLTAMRRAGEAAYQAP